MENDAMEIWDYSFGSDYKGRAEINTLKRILESRKLARVRQRKRTDGLQQRVEDLESEVGELTLICRTLLTTLRETGVIEQEQFHSVMKQIDAEDGVADGRVTPPEPMPEATPYVRPTRKKQ